MSKHFKYLSYVLRHKWFVFVECAKVGLFWRGIVHDLSKFLPSEWFAYAEWFYGGYGCRFNGGMFWQHIEHDKCKERFDLAWLLHLHRNPHHWQFWVCNSLPMPEKYAKEMIADWKGAGRAQGHGNDLLDWYAKNKGKMILHRETRKFVEGQIGWGQL
jgi:hypothetical protein